LLTRAHCALLAMFAVLMFVSAWGFQSQHHETAFLAGTRHVQAPADESMGPNMSFSPLSTTMQCVINLTIQYLLIFTAVGIARTYCELSGTPSKESPVVKALDAAKDTVFFAPMACLLFVASRMRALQLTRGEGAPQEWVQMCMQAAAWSILANTLLVLGACCFADFDKASKLQSEDEGISLQAENPFANSTMKAVFEGVRYLAFFGLFIGMAGVCVGIYTFEPPQGMWEGAVPDVSPAVGCTATLAMMFFAVYFALACARTYSHFKADGGLTAAPSTVEQACVMASKTMGMAPMLCVLFLGARMRALQMDPINGNPQRWAQNCFFLCTYALVFQTCVAIFVPLVLSKVTSAIEVKEVDNKVQGDLKLDAPGAPMLAQALTVLRFLVMLSLYAGAVAVVCSVFTIEHPDGAEHTIAISPTMQCVCNLAFQYFFVLMLVWMFQTIEDLTDYNFPAVRDAVESARATVEFAPMLSVLFIATRMRALQISDNKGSPQKWAQDGMYMASWALLIQFLMCLLMPIFTQETYKVAAIGAENVKNKVEESGGMGAYIVVSIRWVAVVGLYGGLALVITSVFLITPETANGRGSIPLLGDGTLPIDLIPGAPPSAVDVPGVGTAMEATGETVGAGADVVHGF